MNFLLGLLQRNIACWHTDDFKLLNETHFGFLIPRTVRQHICVKFVVLYYSTDGKLVNTGIQLGLPTSTANERPLLCLTKGPVTQTTETDWQELPCRAGPERAVGGSSHWSWGGHIGGAGKTRQAGESPGVVRNLSRGRVSRGRHEGCVWVENKPPCVRCAMFGHGIPFILNFK